jgi:molybdopterin molybdotransferase
MVAFEEARRIILEHVTVLPAERVSLLESLGRVLSEDVIAPCNLPNFSNSAMDGYAVRAADCRAGRGLPIIDQVFAGGCATKSVVAGTAIKIMTGALLPDGADSILPFEDAEEADGIVRVMRPVALHQHVRFCGEDVCKGEIIVASGTVVRPFEINILACSSQEYVAVVRRPKVAIVATGDELIQLGETPSIGQIINSNSYSLAAAITSVGAIPVLVGIARDEVDSHREKLLEGLKADVLITCAGVAMGDRDLVREVLDGIGVENIFWRVQVKPGKGLAFGTKNGKPVFALPGNPVSAMITFESFVAPALLKMMGHKRMMKRLFPAVLQSDMKKSLGQTHLVRVKLECSDGKYMAWSAGKQDTCLLKTMVRANALAVLPADRTFFAAGEVVYVHLLDGSAGMTEL